MDEVLVVCVSELLRLGVVNFGEYERGERRGVRGGRCSVFGQNCSVVGDTGTVIIAVLAVVGGVEGIGMRTREAEWRMRRTPW